MREIEKKQVIATIFLNMKLLLIPFLIYGCKETNRNFKTINVSAGTIERYENMTSKYISPRNVDVWLPDDYNAKNEYSVLYMHDGQMLFDSTTTWNNQEWGVDEVMGRLMKENNIAKCIVVGIWNSGKGRHSDYFPQKPFEKLSEDFKDSLMQDTKRNAETALFSDAIQSDNYLKFIVKELKPFIDNTYSTKANRENTFIAGSSMGGLISIYAICEYPEVFGGAACLSTHWIGIYPMENNPVPGVFFQYLTNNLPSPSTHKIYFDYGTETLDSLYEPYQFTVDSIMKRKGFDNAHWMTLKFDGEDHSENAWRKRLHIPVTFLLEKRTKW